MKYLSEKRTKKEYADMTNKNILNQLTSMFYEFMPDSEYLEENDDVKNEVTEIEAIINSENTTDREKIKRLVDFNNEWFPDGDIDQEERDDYIEVLKQAEDIVNH